MAWVSVYLITVKQRRKVEHRPTQVHTGEPGPQFFFAIQSLISLSMISWFVLLLNNSLAFLHMVSFEHFGSPQKYVRVH